MTKFELEAQAYAAFTDVLKQSQIARDLFERAGLPIPPTLARIFGDDEQKPKRRPVEYEPLPMPLPPPGSKDDWTWVPVEQARPVTLFKAVMRANGNERRPIEIVRDVQRLRPDITSTVIYNNIPRLKQIGIIVPGPNGLKLSNDDFAPILHDGNLWGAPEIFQSQEMAWHRRMVISHLLNVSSDGLQVMQIVNALKDMKDCKAPVSKDLLKADMEVMQQDGRVRRIGGSGKWTVNK